MISCEIVVTGKVQGVGFRRFVLDLAGQFNISGYVKNRYTGQVYILATGQEANIKLFIDRVKAGNLFSRVEKVTSFTIPVLDETEGFYIK
ncbi:acylphosphatase [bacterium]|nr:acylphosphatase [bacterium]